MAKKKLKKNEHSQISEKIIEKKTTNSNGFWHFPISQNLKKQFSEIFDKINDKPRQIGTFSNTAGASYAKEKKLEYWNVVTICN